MNFVASPAAGICRSTEPRLSFAWPMLVTVLTGLIGGGTVSAAGFSNAALMDYARWAATATLLPNGTVLLANGSSGNSPSAERYDPASNTWTLVADSGQARYFATGTLLPNGKVLIAGGKNPDIVPFPALNSAKLYNPASNTWSSAANLTTARHTATATLLANGKVLVTGGQADFGTAFNDAEMYDPVADTWSPAGNFTTGRFESTATLLPNGKVLLASGSNSGNQGVTAADLYDPATNTWSAALPMTTARTAASATLLANGKVLVAGGISTVGAGSFLNSAELYDPVTNTWSAAGNLGTRRASHTTTLLPSGKVLVAGGATTGGVRIGGAELYDPATNSWSGTGSLAVARSYASATLMPNGKVLVAGGVNTAAFPDGTAEIYDPTASSWSAAGNLGHVRRVAMATLLPSGKVLVAGGFDSAVAGPALASAETYDATTNIWSAAGVMGAARFGTTAILLPNGKVLLPGGANTAIQALAGVELYDPGTNNWSTANPMTTARIWPTVTLLPNGKVLVAGGSATGGAPIPSAEIYDVPTNTWSPAGTPISAREVASATLLPSGKVLVAGGSNGAGGVVPGAELYDPGTDSWSAAGTLLSGRFFARTTLLPNGKVLLVGGTNGTTQPDTAELYNPATNTWSGAGVAGSRFEGTSTLLTTGQVLLAGGLGSPPVQLYNPDTNSFTTVPGLVVARSEATATLLPGGKVLVAGGYNGSSALASAELFDLGLGFANARRPVVTTATNPLPNGSALALSGSLFRGDSGGSDGSTNDSATNYPLVQLLRLDNQRMAWANPAAAATSFSPTAWTSAGLSGLQSGPHLVTMFVNGLPSVSLLIQVGAVAIAPPTFGSAVSRKMHGAAGTFDLPLGSVLTNPTTEPRTGPTQTMVLTFDKAINAATATISEGVATAAAPTFSGNDVIVVLTGVNNQQYVTVALSNVASSDGGTGGSGVVRIGFLAGDVNQNRVVTVADLGLVNAQLAQTVTATNYLKDVNASGTLTVGDKGIANANLTKALPAP
jgi:N-acetylneuraminic acid mutarotase